MGSHLLDFIGFVGLGCIFVGFSFVLVGFVGFPGGPSPAPWWTGSLMWAGISFAVWFCWEGLYGSSWFYSLFILFHSFPLHVITGFIF